jgi:putative peptidoglycan lipid II flippase
MLVVFAPQILLYGISVVLYGLLQAYRRFAGPTLGPAISSLVIIAACLAFVPLSGGQPLGSLPVSAELVLSVGTTLGVAALVVVGIVPTWRLHLRFRPVLRFPPGVARRAGGLALCGLVEIIVVDLSSVVAIALANGHGTTGTIVIFNYATQVFTSVSAVLAISVVLSAFPVLSARDGPEFDRTSAGSTRAVLLLSWLGTAAIVAIALPAGRVLASQPDQVPELVQSFVLFAPGVAGFAVIANLTRVMFVIGRPRAWPAAGRSRSCWMSCWCSWCRRTWWRPRLRWGTPSARPRSPSRWCWSPAGSAAGPPSRAPATPRWPGWPPGPSAPASAWPSAWPRRPAGSSRRPPWRRSRPAAPSSRSPWSPTSWTGAT